ncbi:MAG TPA: hypothetical protein DCL60_13900 [Armatimonadetes bacterium]|nr:hypothetical protein [Armatimonadota bacterium]
MIRGKIIMLPFCLELDGYTVIGAFNLSLDDWPSVIFDLDEERLPARIEELSPEGLWREAESVKCSVSGSGLRVVVSKPLEVMSMTILTLWWKE